MEKTTNSVFCKNLKQLMRRQGFTQSELARRLGLRPQTIQKWVAGKSSPRSQTLLKLARVLQTEPGDLLQSKRSTRKSNESTTSIDRLLTNSQVKNLPDEKLILLIQKMASVPASVKLLAQRLETANQAIIDLKQQLKPDTGACDVWS